MVGNMVCGRDLSLAQYVFFLLKESISDATGSVFWESAKFAFNKKTHHVLQGQ